MSDTDNTGSDVNASIDYIEDVMGSGFKIDNPNAVSSCGCGNSFQATGEERPKNHGCNC